MSVLVIGSASMLGSELATQLRAGGVAVRTSTRSGDCDLVYDLESMASPPGTGSADALFVCAASFADDSWDGCVRNALVNTVAMYRVAEWAEHLRCRHVVLASSAWGYAEQGLPASSYGLSKAHGADVLAWAGGKVGFTTTVLQLPQICDDRGGFARHQPWFARIIARAASGADLRLAPNDQPRNFLHVRDAARVMIATWRAGLGGTHSLTSPEWLAYREIAVMAYAVFDAGGSVVDAPEMKPFRPALYPSASQAAWALLGGERISMRATLEGINAAGTANRFGTA